MRKELSAAASERRGEESRTLESEPPSGESPTRRPSLKHEYPLCNAAARSDRLPRVVRTPASRAARPTIARRARPAARRPTAVPSLPALRTIVRRARSIRRHRRRCIPSLRLTLAGRRAVPVRAPARRRRAVRAAVRVGRTVAAVADAERVAAAHVHAAAHAAVHHVVVRVRVLALARAREVEEALPQLADLEDEGVETLWARRGASGASVEVLSAAGVGGREEESAKEETHLEHDVLGLELPDGLDVVVEPRRLLVERERVAVLGLLLVLRARERSSERSVSECARQRRERERERGRDDAPCRSPTRATRPAGRSRPRTTGRCA